MARTKQTARNYGAVQLEIEEASSEEELTQEQLKKTVRNSSEKINKLSCSHANMRALKEYARNTLDVAVASSKRAGERKRQISQLEGTCARS